MPRDWTDVFITGDGATVAAAGVEEPEQRRGFFRRLRENLSKTREALSAEIQATLFEGELDGATWERLEEALIMADVGARTTAEVVAKLETEAEAGGLEGGEALSERLAELLADIARAEGRPARPHRPAPRPDGDHGRRRQRDRQDDHDRQAGLAPAARAGPDGRARRGRHLPRRRGRAADPVGAARRLRDRHAARRARTPARSPSKRSSRAASSGADVIIVDTAGRLHTQDT